MSKKVISFFLLLWVSFSVSAADQELRLWALDPLVKVFPDARYQPDTEAVADVARGEYATLQVILKPAGFLKNINVSVTDFSHVIDRAQKLTDTKLRFVGYVPVDRPIPDPPADQLRTPPAYFPDPLLEQAPKTIGKNQVQPIWVTTKIPVHAEPGSYRATLNLTAKINDKDVAARFPLTIKVYPVTIKKPRLKVTNWFRMHWPGMEIDPEENSPEYFALLRRYARNMAEHYQNVALIWPIRLTEYSIDDDNEITFDFSLFDKWVEIFIEEGVIGTIEGGHFGKQSDWGKPFIMEIRKVENGEVVEASVPPDSPAAEKFYSRFLPAFVSHLKQKGWYDIYIQHLGDEPQQRNKESYSLMASLVKKYAPGLPVVEATHAKDLVGSIDIWVPMLNILNAEYDFFKARQKAGDQLWFYTCWKPQGEYANRFIEQPLYKTRILHWINFKYGVTGYLHWGYNWGWDFGGTTYDPFSQTTPRMGSNYLPAGDGWIVYPGKDGPLDSIRFEAMRDGIVDYELLSMLAGEQPRAAQEIVDKFVINLDKYNFNLEEFRKARRQLLLKLSPSEP